MNGWEDWKHWMKDVQVHTLVINSIKFQLFNATEVGSRAECKLVSILGASFIIPKLGL